MILFGRFDLANPSFESDADGAAPSGWDLAASVGAAIAVDASTAFDTGGGVSSLRSLRLGILDATPGDVAVARQRVSLAGVPAWAISDGVEFAVSVMRRDATAKALRNGTVSLAAYGGAGATAEPGTGDPLPLVSARSLTGLGGPWYRLTTAARLPEGATFLDVEIRNDPARAGYESGASIWIDRVLLGVLYDARKGWKTLRFDPDEGVAWNLGDGVAEGVRFRADRMKIAVSIANVLSGTEDDLALRAWRRWERDAPKPGLVSLWLDRDRYLAAEGHFENCIPTKTRIDVPPGVFRSSFEFEFQTTGEAI